MFKAPTNQYTNHYLSRVTIYLASRYGNPTNPWTLPKLCKERKGEAAVVETACVARRWGARSQVTSTHRQWEHEGEGGMGAPHSNNIHIVTDFTFHHGQKKACGNMFGHLSVTQHHPSGTYCARAVWLIQRCWIKNYITPIGRWVLVANVRIPTFVSFLSTVLILSQFCPTFVSNVSLFCPLSHFCLVCVFKFSVLSWSGLVFVINGLKTVPLLSSFDQKMARTNTGQR